MFDPLVKLAGTERLEYIYDEANASVIVMWDGGEEDWDTHRQFIAEVALQIERKSRDIDDAEDINGIIGRVIGEWGRDRVDSGLSGFPKSTIDQEVTNAVGDLSAFVVRTMPWGVDDTQKAFVDAVIDRYRLLLYIRKTIESNPANEGADSEHLYREAEKISKVILGSFGGNDDVREFLFGDGVEDCLDYLKSRLFNVGYNYEEEDDISYCIKWTLRNWSTQREGELEKLENKEFEYGYSDLV